MSTIWYSCWCQKLGVGGLGTGFDGYTDGIILSLDEVIDIGFHKDIFKYVFMESLRVL